MCQHGGIGGFSEKGDLPGRSLAAILDETSSPEGAAAAGSAAALSTALAASLVAMVLRPQPRGDEDDGLLTQAESLRLRAVGLAGRSRDDYEAARLALAERHEDPGYRDHRIGVALDRTLESLRGIAGCAADTAELAAIVAGECDPALKPDAASAALMAEAAARIAATLTRANLLSTSGDRTGADVLAELEAASAARERAGEAAGEA